MFITFNNLNIERLIILKYAIIEKYTKNKTKPIGSEYINIEKVTNKKIQEIKSKRFLRYI
jgi:hypothetical protein